VNFTSNGTVTVVPFAGVITVITPTAKADTGTQKMAADINSHKINCRLQTLPNPDIESLAEAGALQQPL